MDKTFLFLCFTQKCIHWDKVDFGAKQLKSWQDMTIFHALQDKITPHDKKFCPVKRDCFYVNQFCSTEPSKLFMSATNMMYEKKSTEMYFWLHHIFDASQIEILAHHRCLRTHIKFSFEIRGRVIAAALSKSQNETLCEMLNWRRNTFVFKVEKGWWDLNLTLPVIIILLSKYYCSISFTHFLLIWY